MLRQPFCNFCIENLSLTDFGFEIPSPFCSLTLSNSEITSMTSWTLKCVVTGDSQHKINISAFEALIYQASSYAINVGDNSGTPVSFMFGWLNNGKVENYISYTGFYINYSVSTDGLYMTYTLTGYAQLAIQTSAPVYTIPSVSGYVQPSAVFEALYNGLGLNVYYDLDIDHNDRPVWLQHNTLTTSVNDYVRGTISNNNDDYNTFPGLLAFSHSYNANRYACGIKSGYKLSTIINSVSNVSNVANYLVDSITDYTPQSTSFSYYVEEPTSTRRGVMHYKSDAGLNAVYNSDVLEFGTANTNILSLSGSFNGIAYNMTDLGISQVGFSLDASGNSISNADTTLNSYSRSVQGVYKTANIINNVNAIASQFSGEFSITIAGSTERYQIAQPVTLIVMSGNTLSPITGIYNIKSITHNISNTFTTNMSIQRLQMSKANEVALDNDIYVDGKSKVPITFKTNNIITPYYVDFGEMYPKASDVCGGML